jgi:hypothetical protein
LPASVISCLAHLVALSTLRVGSVFSRSRRRWCHRAICSMGVWMAGVGCSVSSRRSSQVSKPTSRRSSRLGIMR